MGPTPPPVQPPSPTPPAQLQERAWAVKQIQSLKQKAFNLEVIIFLLMGVIILSLLSGAGYLIYKYYQDPSKKLTFDIPTELIKKPEVKKNEVKTWLVDQKFAATYSTAQIDRISNTLYPTYSKLTAKYGEDEYLVHYISTDQNGKPITIRAQIFVPKDTGTDKMPIFVFGHGTTGVADKCAPSQERPEVDNWGNYYNHLRTYAGQGFITVFPDYEGFDDDSRIHHYFSSQLESNVLLDGARAGFEFAEKNQLSVEKAAFFGGYSEGGHAAFAVKDNQPTYAIDVPIKGVIGFGPTTDIYNLLKDNSDLGPYLFYAYADLYGKNQVPLDEMLQPKWLPTLQNDVLSKCISAAANYWGAGPKGIYSDKFYDSLYNDKIGQDFPTLKKLFDENSSGTKVSATPALIIQGGTDPIVTVESQEQFVKLNCNIGNKLTYLKFEGVHHYQTRHVSFKDVVGWMNSILNGSTPPSICDDLGSLGKSGISKPPEENFNTPPPPGGNGGG
jgi:pimeloyl-ACP methyl ester carboxylesterase